MDHKNSDRIGERHGLTRRQLFELGAGLGLVLTLTPSGSFAEGREELAIAIPADLGGWDHDYLAFDLVGLAVMKNCYPFMIEYGVKEQGGARVMDTGTVEPVFAESWESDAEGKVWTLKVRKGVKFPSGNEMTAHDVKWSKDRAFAAKANVAGVYRLIGLSEASQVEVVDDYTVRFTQSQPSDLSNHIQIICLFVYDSEELKKHATADDPWAKDWATKNPQSGGAYNVADYKAGQEIVLEANPSFPLDAPRVKRVKLQVIPAPANRRLLLEKGEIDIALGLSRRDIDDLRGKSGIEVISSPSNEFVFMPMAMGTPPFDNPLVRRAMAHVVPYDAIVANVYNGNARRSTSPVPLDMPGHSPAGYPFGFDIDKAKALLAEAGTADGFESEIAVLAGDVAQERAAVLVSSAAAQAGIELKVTPLDPGTLFQRRSEKTLPLQIANGQMWVNDIEYLLAVCLTPTGFLNYAGYDNPRIVEIFQTLNRTSDKAARNTLFAEVQGILAADVPWLVLAQPHFDLPVSAGVSGWVQPVDGLFRLRYLDA
ncbi:MAG: ABC transporter substrate-binding protein [Immundisolibacterales bacterium]|nr:ABC transporter substrate-binding protein [Immundisolibacterales bacterium]